MAGLRSPVSKPQLEQKKPDKPRAEQPKHKENSYLIPKYDRRNFNGPSYNINQEFLLNHNQTKTFKKSKTQVPPSKNYSTTIQQKQVKRLNLTER